MSGNGSGSPYAGFPALRDLVVGRLAARLGLAPGEVDPCQSFSHYGLDSAGATGLIAELGEALGRPLSATLAWAYPSPEELARHLSAEGNGSKRAGARARRAARRDEPIAVVGMSCRFPGADEPRDFWRRLLAGYDAMREIPRERWPIDNYYDPDPQAPGTINTRRGAFLDRIDLFDPLFFGISPREAAEMDPQQRLALELTWEALEDAGIPPRGLAGSRTGVFLGVIWKDYGDRHREARAAVTSHTGVGQALNIVANRISYALGLRGPSLVLDTACSSSLVAIHLACQSLWDGESTVALAGGVNLMLSADVMVSITKFGGLSGDGRCKAFDAAADGFARGEGGGLVVLKPLSRALADGDPVYCVIRGSAVNNDGASNGLTAPNPQAQEEVLRDAYERAGVEPSRVGYVEAHGTGTPLGDPIEARALAAVLCEERPADRPLRVGSVKTNIGHLEGAAGIAGVIKLALALRHREIPPSLHFVNPNPHIPFEELKLRVATATQPWPAGDGPRVGGVSSFGWGGTNCHIVMEEWGAAGAGKDRKDEAGGDEAGVTPRSEAGGALRPGVYTPGYIRSPPDGGLRQPNAGPRREPPEGGRQAVAWGVNPRSSGVAPDASSGCAPAPAGSSDIAFLFGPQGGQWPGMGRDLLAEPAFRAAVARCDRAFRPLLGWSVLEEIAAGAAGRLAEALDEGEIVEPLLFTVQVALAALWRSRGVEPDVVIGHSLGEMAAAHVAGALSLEDAALVVVEYQRAQRRANAIKGGEPGGMALVNLSPEALAPRLAPYADRVVIAGYNSPATTGLSGDPAALDAILAPLKAEGVFASRIAADAAVHSPQMEPALDGLRQALAGIRPRRPRVPLFSTVDGAPVDGPLAGDYWCRNLRQPVRFVEALTWLFDRGTRLLVEIDPHPVLAIPVEQTLAARGHAPAARNLPSMRRGEPGLAVLEAAEAALRFEGWESSPRGGRFELFPLSGRTPEALRDAARLTAARLREPRQPDTAPLADLAYTAALRRSHHEHRLALMARTREDLAGRLDAFARGEAVAGAAKGRAGRQDRDDRPRLVFAFSGQGPQWAGMGRQLFAEEPVYRAAVERCDDLLRPHLGFSVLERLAAEEGALEHTEVAQPALFALQVGLAELWRSRGVEPDAVIGHSVGEIAAAWAAGVFPLDEAARIVALRGRTMQPAQGRGKMAAVELPEAEAAAALAGYEDRVCVAAVNSPAASVLAGEPAALEAVLDRLRAQGVTCRMLRVEYAFHSPQMEPYDAELERALAGLAPRAARIPFASTVLPGLAAGPELGAAYWRGNVRRPVRFADAVAALGREGFSAFLEIGPHPVLAVAIAQTLESREPTVLASLRRNLDERETTLEAFGTLYTLGLPVDWNGLFPDAGRVVSLGGLPAYPFQRQRYWFEPGEAPAPAVQPAPAAPPDAPAFAVVPLAAAEPSDPGVEQVLAGQIDAFTRLVTLQLDLLRGGAEDFPRDDA